MKERTKTFGTAKTRSYGGGSFTLDKRNNNWIYKKRIDGKVISRSGKTQNECRKRMKEIERELLAKKVLGQPDIQDFLEQPLQEGVSAWLYNVKRPAINKSSYFDSLDTAYRNQLMNSDLGRAKMNDVTSYMVQMYLNTICEQTSESTANKSHAILSQFTKYVRGLGHNVSWMDTVVKPKRPHTVDEQRHGMMILDDDQIEALANELAKPYERGKIGYRYGFLYMFLIWAFLRIGEALVLKWGDVNFETGKISINKTLSVVRNRDKDGRACGGSAKIIVLPKSRSGNRTLKLPDKALECLRKHRDLYSGSFTDQNDYVFCTENGKMIGQSHLNEILKKALSRAGIDKALSLHDLRHTGISYWLRHGANIKRISRIAGHSDVSITMRIYYNLLPEEYDSAFDIDEGYRAE